MPRGAKPTQGMSKEGAQRVFLDSVRQGMTSQAALEKAGRTSLKTVEFWRKDPEFARRHDEAKEEKKGNGAHERNLKMPFEDFSIQFLGHKPYWHHLQWIDVLEGRPPRDLHPMQQYEPSRQNRLLVNTPPHHGKTATITINYVVYRICMDPNVRIKLVSKNEGMAKQFLYAIKSRLTHPRFSALQAAYAPQNPLTGVRGWRETADTWSTTMLYLGGDEKDSGEKDPTVQALGMGGFIYGARSNLIILDDCIVGSNAHQWENQMNWINREVDSRLGRTGKLLVVGTRISQIDLYRELRNGDNFSAGKSPFTYLSQPAVLEYADHPKDWKTLWPKSSSPIEEGSDEEEADEDGMFAAWDGEALAEVRSSKSSKDWALVYMQQDVAEDATFPEYAVKGVCNGMRRAGALKAGAVGHPPNGADGMHVIGSMDPSGTGDTAFLAMAVDRATKKRYVLDCKTITPWSWNVVTGIVQNWTEEYGIREWVVEKNMYHSTFRQNEALNLWLQARGVRTREHYTGSTKQDVNLGVASLAPLFGEWELDGAHYKATTEPLMEFPGQMRNEMLKKLIEQLITWAPDTKNKTDLVMALWFADLRARELVNVDGRYSKSHTDNKYLSGYRAAQRRVVSIAEYRQMTA